jgi:gliding motility-associated-like protein
VLTPVLNEITSLNYFKIYNRWGQLVFYTKELNKGWDGTFKGSPVTSGAYVWSIEGIASDGKVLKKDGTVLLIK